MIPSLALAGDHSGLAALPKPNLNKPDSLREPSILNHPVG